MGTKHPIGNITPNGMGPDFRPSPQPLDAMILLCVPDGPRPQSWGAQHGTEGIAKRSAGNFLIFAACAFILWILAAAIDWIAQLLRLSTPERMPALAASIVSSSTLQAIVAIWLLTAAVAIAFPEACCGRFQPRRR
jgi:hypothetical protein